MPSNLSRRFVLSLVPAAVALAALPAAALTNEQAKALIDKAVGEVNAVIASGASEGAMIGKFEGIFARYADVPTIARSALGPAAKTASTADLQAYTSAFRGYMARKYGKRFREFAGGQIEVLGAQKVKSFYEVTSTAKLKGQAPFELRWHVSSGSGKNLFFNIIIEGVNMLASERGEIGAMLDRAGGDVGKLAVALQKAG